MKKLLSLLMAILMLSCLPALAEDAAQVWNANVAINGEPVTLVNENGVQQPLIVVNGVVYMPVNAFMDAIGGEVTYNLLRNQVNITLPTDGPADDHALVGRWEVIGDPNGCYMTIYDDHTGETAGNNPSVMYLTFTWELSGTTLICDYSDNATYTFELVSPDELALSINPSRIFTRVEEPPVLGRWEVIGDAHGSYMTIYADHTGEAGGNSSIVMYLTFTWEFQDNILTIHRSDDNSYSFELISPDELALTINPARVFTRVGN